MCRWCNGLGHGPWRTQNGKVHVAYGIMFHWRRIQQTKVVLRNKLCYDKANVLKMKGLKWERLMMRTKNSMRTGPHHQSQGKESSSKLLADSQTGRTWWKPQQDSNSNHILWTFKFFQFSLFPGSAQTQCVTSCWPFSMATAEGAALTGRKWIFWLSQTRTFR